MSQPLDRSFLMFSGGRPAPGKARYDWTAIYIGALGETVYLHVRLNRLPNDEDRESLSEIESEVYADLRPGIEVQSRFSHDIPREPGGVKYWKCWP